MGFLKKHTALFRGLTNVTVALLLLVVVVFVYATGTYRSKVDEFLGTNSGAVEHSADLADYKYRSDYDNVSDLMEAEKGFNTRAAGEGCVLLKGSASDVNVGEGSSVTLFGMKSRSLIYNSSIGGTSNANLAVRLDTALADRGIKVNETMVKFYGGLRTKYPQTNFKAVNEVPVSEYTADAVASYSEYKDAAIIVLGRPCSEGSDFQPGEAGLSDVSEFSQSETKNILSLSDDERDLIAHVKSQGFEKVIVLLNTANAMEIDSLANDPDIDAILWIGTPGCYGTYGVADILAGNVLPSGHLTDTYLVDTSTSPSIQNFGKTEYANQSEVDSDKAFTLVESEGIYIGYKYTETRYYDVVMGNYDAAKATPRETADGGTTWNYDDEVTYSFGYGIEGSTFSETIGEMEIDWTGKTDSSVTVRVTNTGAVAAKHVVQLYVRVPYTDYDRQNGIEKSAIQLVGYGKTGEAKESGFTETVLLAPQESEEIVITFNVKDFSSWDSSYAHDGTFGAYALEAGTYYFSTGNGAHDAVQSVIMAQDPDKLSEADPTAEPTGAVATAEKQEKTVFTEGADGYIIENQLEDMDFTYSEYGDTFTSRGAKYLTRQDWSGTFPVSVSGVTANAYMKKYLNNNFYDAAAANAAYTGKEYTAEDFAKEGTTGAYTVIDLIGLTDYNDPMFEKVLSCIPLSYYSTYLAGSNAAIPEIYLEHANAADSPNGYIYGYGLYTSSRPPFALSSDDPAKGVSPNVYVGEPVIAATFSHLIPSEQGRLIGNDGLWVGAHWWFGPGLNLHRTPYNGRNNEYYSEDSVLSGNMAVDVVKGCQAKGIVACAKHYAFNDQETAREGVGVFTSEQAARENELRGFELAITRGKMKSVMTGFNRAGVIHTSMHSGLISGILRGEWGHEGLVITDSVKDKNYMLAAESVMAGTDFMLGGSGVIPDSWSNISAENVINDKALLGALREAMHRYLYTFADSALVDGYPETVTFAADPWWEVLLLSLLIVSGVLAAASGGLWTASAVLEHRQKEGGAK